MSWLSDTWDRNVDWAKDQFDFDIDPGLANVGTSLVGGMLGGNSIGSSLFSALGSGLDMASARELAELPIKSQERINERQIEEAGKLREWQKEMSSTAHQRAVDDLRSAGLNPILAARTGASSPAGAMPNLKSGAERYGADVSAYQAMRADMKLKREVARTERTKQKANLAHEKATLASVSGKQPWIQLMTALLPWAERLSSSSAKAESMTDSIVDTIFRDLILKGRKIGSKLRGGRRSPPKRKKSWWSW